jgi:hypothetical protein
MRGYVADTRSRFGKEGSRGPRGRDVGPCREREGKRKRERCYLGEANGLGRGRYRELDGVYGVCYCRCGDAV